MRDIKFKYGYSDGITMFEKTFTLDEIEQGLQFDETSDSPLLKNHKIVHKRQFTGSKNKNGVDIYEGDIIKIGFPYIVEYGEYYIGVQDSNSHLKEKTIGFYLKDYKFNTIYPIKTTQGKYDYEVIGNIYENKELLGS